MGMFYEQEITVVLPVNQPASNKVLLRTVTPQALHAVFSSVEICCQMRARCNFWTCHRAANLALTL